MSHVPTLCVYVPKRDKGLREEGTKVAGKEGEMETMDAVNRKGEGGSWNPHFPATAVSRAGKNQESVLPMHLLLHKRTCMQHIINNIHQSPIYLIKPPLSLSSYSDTTYRYNVSGLIGSGQGTRNTLGGLDTSRLLTRIFQEHHTITSSGHSTESFANSESFKRYINLNIEERQ